MSDVTPYLCSQAALQMMREELEHLETDGRAAVTSRFEEARGAEAELSENAAYQMALLENDLLYARIAVLQDLIARAHVPRRSSRCVTVGVVVTVAVRRKGRRPANERLVLDVAETVPGVDVVSPSSPMGQALLGAAIGDEVSWLAPAGEMRAEIVSIETPRTPRR